MKLVVEGGIYKLQNKDKAVISNSSLFLYEYVYYTLTHTHTKKLLSSPSYSPSISVFKLQHIKEHKLAQRRMNITHSLSGEYGSCDFSDIWDNCAC